MTYAVFPRVRFGRFQDNFYVHQVFSGHCTFRDHQAGFSRKDPTYFCEIDENIIEHCLYVCEPWEPTRAKFFPRSFSTLSHHDLCLYGYCRKEVRVLVNDRLLRTLDQNLCLRRSGSFAKSTGGLRLCSNTIVPTNVSRGDGGRGAGS